MDGSRNRLGRYVLIQPVGRGSFATVWSAYDPELDRRVAIKLLPARNPDAPDDLAGQLAEAQALAQLSHPNVVAVHDVQVLEPQEDDAGGLFIVMEFLEGLSLLEWMEGEHDFREVIEVFTAAGHGLAAAHERGIVHRDFKPSNAMFGSDGRLRVLDFGIARALGGKAGEGSKGRYAGTPAYMAPEQHLGQDVDARSDQFAFCASLYEALYGRRPYAGDDRTSLGKAKLGGEIEPAPRDRTVPAWVHEIVLRGLSVDPKRRFASMDELLAALGHDPRRAATRWAAGITLTLAIAGLGYTLAKFTNEDVAAPVACESGAAKLAGIWDESVRADVETGFHATEAPFAADAFERVAVVLDAHTSQWTRVHREVCEAALVHNEHSVEVMAEQMLCLERRLRRVAGLIGALRRADAATVARAPDSVLRLESPETCRARHAVERPQLDDAQRAELLEIEAEAARAKVLDELGRYDEALATADAAIERATAIEDLAGASEARLVRSKTLWNLGRHAESIDGAEAALANAAAVADPELEALALLQLIRSYTEMGEYDAAEAIGEIARALVHDGRLGHELEVTHDFYVAILNGRQQRFDEAIARLEHALSLSERMYESGDHPELAKLHNTLGNTLLVANRDLDSALEHYEEAQRLWITNFGEQYPSVSLVRNNVAALRLRRGELDEAKRLLEQVVVGFEAVHGPEHPQLVPSHANLALIACFQGRTRDALAQFERARGIAAAAFGADSMRVAEIDVSFANLLVAMGRIDEAEAIFERTLRLQVTELPANHVQKAQCLDGLADCRRARDDMDGWRARAEQAAIIYKSLPREYPDFDVGLALEAEFAQLDGDSERAVLLATQAVDSALSRTDSAHGRSAALTVTLMQILTANGKSAEAVRRGREVLASKAMFTTDRRTYILHLELGRALAREGDREAAIASYQRALELTDGPDGNPREFEAITEELAGFTRRR